MPHILDRIAAHRRAMQSILHCGLAKAHRGNPTASLRLERSYGAPVLLSGVASLVLSDRELSVLHQQYKTCVRQLLRLPITTPESFTMFFAGALPATAIVHLRTLSLLGMISLLGRQGILDRLGRHALLSARNKGSWFLAVRRICQKYSLPDPLIVLQQPLPKARWKSLCKSCVVRWWEEQFRGEAAGLTSLVNFNPHFFSLTKTHRTLSLAGSPHEVSKATTVMLMLSGRYNTCHHTRHWDRSNVAGSCKLCPSSPRVSSSPRNPAAPAVALPGPPAGLHQRGPALDRVPRCPPPPPVCGGGAHPGEPRVQPPVPPQSISPGPSDKGGPVTGPGGVQ